VICPQCGGKEWSDFGYLGAACWYKCRACGWWTWPDKESPYTEDHSPGDKESPCTEGGQEVGL
jgi:hypothetical protein